MVLSPRDDASPDGSAGGGLFPAYPRSPNAHEEPLTRPAATGIIEIFGYNAFGQMTSSTDGEGNETDYVYFAETRPDGEVTTPTTPLRSFDGATGGYIERVEVDRVSGANAGLGNHPPPGPAHLVTIFSYEPVGDAPADIGYAGNPTVIADPRGVKEVRSINELNQVFHVIRAASGATDGSGAPPLDFEERIFYDGNNNVARRLVQHDPGPSATFTETTYQYDLLDNLHVMTVNTGSELLATTYDYDRDQNLVKVTKPEGNTDEYEYDARKLMTKARRGTSDGLLEADTQYVYDGNGNLTDVLDGFQRATHVDYDGYDRQMAVTDRLGNRTETDYDDLSLVHSVTRRGPVSGQGANPATAQTVLSHVAFGYDAIYRRIDIFEDILFDTRAGGSHASHTHVDYDRNSRVIQVTDDNGHALQSYYDGANRLVARIDAVGNAIELTLDANGDPTTTVETEQPGGLQFTSHASFDTLSRMTSATDPLGHARHREYDAIGNVVRTVDAELNVVHHVFDLANRRTDMIQDLAGGAKITTHFTYDRDSRLREMKDDNQNATGYGYDDLDRLTVTTFADTTTRKITAYDVNDNVIDATDQNGTAVHDVYDLDDRLIERDVTLNYRAALGDFDATKETFEYDGLGRMTRAKDDDSQVDRVYDSLGRVTQETESLTGAPPHACASVFDGVGNRLSLAYPSGATAGYAYDEIDRIKTVTDPIATGPLATYAYVGKARVTSRTLANGVSLSLGYDGDRRVTAMAHAGTPGAAPRPSSFDFRYTWTPEDRRIGEQRMHEGGTADLYAYDAIYRLGEARRGARLTPFTTLDAIAPAAAAPVVPPPSGAAAATRDYHYDGAMNLRTAPATVLDPRAATVFAEDFGTPNARNEYTSLVEGGTPLAEGHDANGNTTALRLERRTAASPTPVPADAVIRYDYRNQPVLVTFPGTNDQTTYRYDVLGRRIAKHVVARGVTLVGEIVQGGTVVEDTRYLHDGDREIEERDASDALLARYVYGNGLDEVLAMARGGAVRYFHQNSIGSVAGITDASGVEVERYRYDAYGDPVLERADYAPPMVLQIAAGTGDVEIDFTESIAPRDFDPGHVLIGGVAATRVALADTVTAVPSPAPGVGGPTFRAALHATPAAPLTLGVPVAVTVLPRSRATTIADLSGNPLAATFTAIVTPGVTFPNAGASGTGAQEIATSASGNPWLFQGRRLDPETGLFYFRARYYAPQTGRFLQGDPKGYKDGPNVYAAFACDPANHTDAMGKQSSFRFPWGRSGSGFEDQLEALYEKSDALADRNKSVMTSNMEAAWNNVQRFGMAVSAVPWFAAYTAERALVGLPSDATVAAAGGPEKATELAIVLQMTPLPPIEAGGLLLRGMAARGGLAVTSLIDRVAPVSAALRQSELETAALTGLPSEGALANATIMLRGKAPPTGKRFLIGEYSAPVDWQTMDALQHLHGREVRLLENAQTGKYRLEMSSGSMFMEPEAGWSTVAHTHPPTSALETQFVPSVSDVWSIWKTAQRGGRKSEFVIPRGHVPIEFTAEGEFDVYMEGLKSSDQPASKLVPNKTAKDAQKWRKTGIQ